MTSSGLVTLLILGLLLIATTIVYIRRRKLHEQQRGVEWVDKVQPEMPSTVTIEWGEERTMDSFIPSDNALGILAVLQSDDQAMIGQRIEIAKSVINLGRKADNDVIFTKDAPVSRHHAVIEERNGNLFLSEVIALDEGSPKRPSYGTFVNETRVEDPVRLHDGDEIRLGKRVRLRFEGLNPANTDDGRTMDELDDRVIVDRRSSTHKHMAEKEGDEFRRPRISVSYPELLSKRYESLFLIQIYFSENRGRVLTTLKSEFKNQVVHEQVNNSALEVGRKVKIRLESPEFVFSEPVIKDISTSITKAAFIGMPKDSCFPGLHKILLSIWDLQTQKETEGLVITVRVVDYVFDHVSRPFVSKVSAFALGIGACAMFMLTLFEQVDKTFGITTGTAVGVAAAVIYRNFYNLFQRVRPNKP